MNVTLDSITTHNLIREVIRRIGDDPSRQGFMDTRKRVAKSCSEVYAGYELENKIKKVITQKPFNLIQFFSMRKADTEIGSRWDNNFLMNQCFYAPPNYSKLMLSYYPLWAKEKLENHPNGTDLMVCDWLKSRKEKYWISVPSLVQHRISVSMIDKRRGSTNRQSKTFVDEI